MEKNTESPGEYRVCFFKLLGLWQPAGTTHFEPHPGSSDTHGWFHNGSVHYSIQSMTLTYDTVFKHGGQLDSWLVCSLIHKDSTSGALKHTNDKSCPPDTVQKNTALRSGSITTVQCFCVVMFVCFLCATCLRTVYNTSSDEQQTRSTDSELDSVFGAKTMALSTNMHPQRALSQMAHGN